MDAIAQGRYCCVMNTSSLSVGEHLRQWRQRRRLTQMDLAGDTDISAKHLSFIETGKARPSHAMLLRLCEQLDLPLRARNQMLLAGGYAPAYTEHALFEHAMHETQGAIAALLSAHEPYPALAIDRHWNLVLANEALVALMQEVRQDLINPPVNVLRLSLHPDGLAPHIANLAEWRGHLLHRLHRQYAQTADPALHELLTELIAYPCNHTPTATEGEEGCHAESARGALAVPLRLRTPNGVLSFLSTTMVFGAPLDVTLSELALEIFLPADAATASALKQGI